MELKQGEITRISLALTLEKAAKLAEGEFEAILSSDTLDSQGEHIDVKGIQVPKRTIRMYWNHDKWGQTLPIGTWPKIWKSAGKLMGRGQIDMNDDFAIRVYEKIKAGIVDNISVGLKPIEWDNTKQTWTKSELSEVSVVSEGANPDAEITNKSDFTEDDLKKLAETRQETSAPAEPQVPAAEVSAAIEELKSRVGAVEEAQKAAAENPSTLNKIKVRLAAKEVDKSAEGLNKITKVILRKEN